MSLKPISRYIFTVPANGNHKLLAEGGYFKVLSCTGDVNVVADTFGTFGVVKAGQGLKGNEFRQLTFQDRSGNPNLVEVLIADAAMVDDRITGEVSVIDGGKARTMANMAFIGYGFSSAAAAQYSYGELWNPALSGKRIVVEQLTCGVFAGTLPAVINFGFHNAALATLVGNAASKLSGGAASAAEFRRTTNAGVPSAFLNGPLFWDQYVEAANRPFVWTPKEPIVLLPGSGFAVACQSQNTSFTTSIEFYEEANA